MFYGAGGLTHIPIYGYFRTEAEAKKLQSKIQSQYPESRIAKQGFCYDDENQHREIEKDLFDFFTIRLLTDEFAPRAKCGNLLRMQRGVVAEDGDIVAVDSGDITCSRVAFYAEGMAYFAVATEIRNIGRRDV